MQRIFVDTNLWLYLFDAGDTVKQEMARAAIRSFSVTFEIIVSTQVIVEFCANMHRKLRFSPTNLGEALSVFDPFLVESTTLADAHLALELMGTHSVSFWDAHIIATASRLDCKILLTEDLQSDQMILGCRIRNPFLN